MKATLASALNRTRSAVIDARLITTKRKDNRDLKNSSREKGKKKNIYFSKVRNYGENLLVHRKVFFLLLLFFQCNKICKEEKIRKKSKFVFQVRLPFWSKIAPGTRFSKVPKLFGRNFGWHKSLCTFKTKAFWGTKFNSYFNFPPIYKIW